MNKKYNGQFIIAARFINLFGSGVYNICIPLYILENTQSLITTSLFFSVIQIPTIILLPILGVWLEKRQLKHCLLISNGISFFLFALLGIFIYHYGFNIYFLIVISLLEKINNSIFNVTSSSIFIRLIDKSKIEKTNGIKSVFDNLSNLTAPMLGAIIYGVYGFEAAILVNVFSYIFSFIFTLSLKYEYISEAITKKETFKTMFTGGLKMIVDDEEILSLFLLITSLNFLVAPTEEIFAPGIMKMTYGFSDQLYGWTGTLFSAGVILASLTIGFKKRKKSEMKNNFYLQALIMIITGICSINLIHYNHFIFYYLYLFLCFLSGYFSTLVNVPLMSKFQLMVHPNYQARFFAILSFSSGLMIPLGTLFAGYMSDYFGSDFAYLVNGVIMLLVIYAAFKRMKKSAN